MGFLTKLFGKKNKDTDREETLAAEQAFEETDETDEPDLTEEDEAAAEAAEEAFLTEHPEIADEDIPDEEIRPEHEEDERAASAVTVEADGEVVETAETVETEPEEPVNEPEPAPVEDTTTK